MEGGTRETKKWLNEQRSLKDELKDLLTDMNDIALDEEEGAGSGPPPGSKDEPYSDRSDEDIIFEKNLYKLTGGKEGIPTDEANRILKQRRQQRKGPADQADVTERELPATEERERSSGERKNEPATGKPDMREIPKPKGLNRSVAAVLGHKKNKKKGGQQEEEIRELPKPRGLKNSIKSVMGPKKKLSKDEALKALREKMAGRDGMNTPGKKGHAPTGKKTPEPKKSEMDVHKRHAPPSREAIKEFISQTSARIEKAPSSIDLTKPRELLKLAQRALKEGKNDDALKLARDAKAKVSEIRSEFITARDTLKTSKQKLIDARSKGINIKKAKSLYQQSVKMLKGSNYSMAIQYAKLCLRELERNEILNK